MSDAQIFSYKDAVRQRDKYLARGKAAGWSEEKLQGHSDGWVFPSDKPVAAFVPKLKTEEDEEYERQDELCVWQQNVMAEAITLANKKIGEYIAAQPASKPADPDPFEEKTPKFAIIEAGDFAGKDFVEPEWLVEDLIPARGIGLAWGLSGSHKTGGIFDLMACVHRGIEWRDKDVKRGRCVMVCAEGEYMFPMRMKAYAKHHGINVRELPAIVPSAINLRDSKEVAAFAIELLKLGAAQVWFDTLQQCAPAADENSVKDMGEVITNLKWLAKKIGGFCGVVHHAGKSIEKGARGSSAWRPAVDVELYFESGDGISGTMKVEKLKDAAPFSVYPFKREIVPVGLKGSIVVVQTDDAPKAKTATRKRPKGNDLLVLQAMEKEFIGKYPTIDEVYDVVAESLECPVPKRRKEYMRKAVARLADTEVNKWLWRYAPDRVSLLGVPQGEDFE